ncbi:MAG: hypothetical protein MUQ25_05235 [Candidatus Aminicenantes bacterium]|nr:hypothetical protein [Candidatus Aminicenantes bacterium]
MKELYVAGSKEPGEARFCESLFRAHPDWPSLVPPADEPLSSWLAALVDKYLGGVR